MNAYSHWFNGVAAPESIDVGFEVGDAVELLTGSPPMVVTDICDCGEVTVCWYDHNGIQFYGLPTEALVYVE